VYAHSPNGRGEWHDLVAHLRGTAELAARFAAPFGAAGIAHFLGLAHDAGKAAEEWQSGLHSAAVTGRPVGVDHKALGVEVSGERGLGVIGMLAVQGHHGGLTSRDSFRCWWDDLNGNRGGAARRSSARQALAPLLPELFDHSIPVTLPPHVDLDNPVDVEFFLRMVFSALVDADVLDTRMHCLDLDGPEVAQPPRLGELWERFSLRRMELFTDRRASELDAVRHDLFESCVAAGSRQPGIYRHTAPTGSGKTLAVMGFSLRHAVQHGKQRIIVAVPFTTITEQNAEVYRRLLDPERGDPVVLEHHSNVDASRNGHWARVAAENWDSPVVITTTVQLFESLFGRRCSRSRKVHRLANAVIVLDEVQALPHDLLPVVVDGLRRLTEHYGATVLLASATQPEVQELTALRDVSVHDVLPDARPLYDRLRRVRYDWWLQPRPTLAQVAQRAANTRSALVVVNTVADARRTYRELAAYAPNDALVRHLSTAMCPAHRRAVLGEVSAAQAAGRPCLVASTQLVEAGVDVDFPAVFRAMAPADSLQQAAGRANREGRLGREGGLCVVFDPADGGQPSSYRTAVEVTRRHFGDGRADPDDLDRLRRYYTHLYAALQVEGPRGRAAVVNVARADWDFEAVADGPLDFARGRRDVAYAFRLISDDMVPLVVGYGDEHLQETVASWLERLREQVRTGQPPEFALLRRLQPYIVAVRRRTRDRPEVDALCAPVLTDLAEWRGGYDDALGIELTLPDKEFVV